MSRFQVYWFAPELTCIDYLPVRPGYDKDVSSLVKVTRDMVKMQVKGDAWVLWAVAQRSSLPVTINACIE